MYCKLRLAGCVLASLLTSSCGDDTLPLDEYEHVDVHAYFYYPNNKEKYLGRYRGADACGSAAYAFAKQKDLSNEKKWSYLCCTIRNGSECYETIR
jgi:hypothetical protein